VVSVTGVLRPWNNTQAGGKDRQRYIPYSFLCKDVKPSSKWMRILETNTGPRSWLAGDFQTSITNPPGADAYPVAALSWFVVPAQSADPDKKRALKEFLQWMLSAGERQAAALGYVSIAPQIMLREQQMLDRY